MTSRPVMVAAGATPGSPGRGGTARGHASGIVDVPFVDLRAGYESLKVQIDTAIAGVLARTDFILGQAVESFEAAFARYCGVGHAVGVDSGFSALELVLRAHDVGSGDEVITAANTFVATVAAIDAVGARPVLVDVSPDDYNMDPECLRAAITPATRAVVPVHLYGQPASMEAISTIAAEHGLEVFEDACQAHGGTWQGRRTGSLGDAAAFSFYPSKNLGAFGDGGMVVTDDAEVATRLRKLRNLGTARKHHHEVKGFNRRLDTLQAAVLRVKLECLDADNVARRHVAGCYRDLLAGLPVTTPTVNEGAEHVFHLYVVEVDDRPVLQAHLQAAGIATGIHYPVPVHLQPAYRSLGRGPGSFEVTERAAARILSLPIYPQMPLESVQHVVRSVAAFYSG